MRKENDQSKTGDVVTVSSGALLGGMFVAGNRHIITGPNRMCLCGVYHGETIHCDKLIKGIERIRTAGVSAGEDAFWLATAMLHLIQDCDAPMPPNAPDQTPRP